MKTRFILLFIFFSFMVAYTKAQTNPVPYTIANGDFIFDGFSDGSVTDYPASMQGWIGTCPNLNDPNVTTAAPVNNQATGDAIFNGSGGDVYATTIVNESMNGISIRGNYGGPGGPQAIALSLNTMGAHSVTIAWKAFAVSTYPSRITSVQLQYREGTSGNWTNFANNVYDVDPSKDKSGTPSYFTATLPSSLEGKPVVQLRWLNFCRFDAYGPVSNNITHRIAIDSIVIHSSNNTPQPPTADFNADNTNPEVNTPIQFKDLCSGAPKSYSWDFGDGSTDTVANPTHTYSQAGTYNVQLIAKNQVGSDTAFKANYITVADSSGNPSGIVQNKMEHLSIYPNPAKEKFFFSKKIEEFTQVSIIDMNGKESMKKLLTVGDSWVDVSELPIGVYIVRLKNQSGIQTIKLVK